MISYKPFYETLYKKELYAVDKNVFEILKEKRRYQHILNWQWSDVKDDVERYNQQLPKEDATMKIELHFFFQSICFTYTYENSVTRHVKDPLFAIEDIVHSLSKSN